VFALVVAVVFDVYPAAATASVLYIAMALLFGVYLYQLNLPFLPGAVAFIGLVFAGVWVGIEYPIALVDHANLSGDAIVLLGDASSWEWLPLADAQNVNRAAWVPVVILYAFLASVLPVWVLLQPRDFLTSSLLYVGVGGMLLGVLIASGLTLFGGGFSVTQGGTTYTSLETSLPAFKGLNSALGPIFPFLFVTIACGTISGFHSLVSSGTTAKQLDKESDARTIGYGAMLGEGLLATTSVAALAIIGAATWEGGGIVGALANFPSGGAVMLGAGFGLATSIGATFIGLVFVSFLLTSTDTATRLGRYMLEEVVGTPETGVQKTATNRYFSTGILLCLPAYLLVGSGSWSTLWPLFGGANQTLAALALLAATLWLANWDDSKQLISTGLPMALMLGVTITALLWIGLYTAPTDALNASNLSGQLSAALQSVIALVLAGLAVSLSWMGYKNISDVRDNYTGTVTSDD
jgi:carbon starvation protein